MLKNYRCKCKSRFFKIKYFVRIMKDIIIGVLLIVLGFVVGLLCRPKLFRDTTTTAQNDTVVRYEKIKYTPLELKDKTIQLDVPKISALSMVYLPYDSTMVVYRDSVRYISLPRQYYYTSTEDAEIWHSGIDSTIDSLNVVAKNVILSKTETATKLVRHSNHLRLGVEASYCSTLSLPIYLEYEKMLHKNVGLRAGFFYDLPTRLYGLRVGANVQIGW